MVNSLPGEVGRGAARQAGRNGRWPAAGALVEQDTGRGLAAEVLFKKNKVYLF